MQKSKRVAVLKVVDTDFFNFSTSTFVLRLFKVLSADGRASASNVEKKANKVEIFQFLEIFSKVAVQKLNVCACLTPLIKPYKKKI
jgi:hypothetical protein